MTDKTDRRGFLKGSLLGAAAVVAGCTSSWKLDDDDSPIGGPPSVKTSTLVQVRGTAVSSDLPGALARLLEPLGGPGAFVKPGQTVLLKPNMGFARPPRFRSTTSVELIASVARMALDQGAGKVLVADHPVDSAEDVIEAMGLRGALEGLDVRLLAVGDDSRWVETPVPDGKALRSIEVLAEAAEADVHIALPIAKSHGSAGFTGTLKGMMGLVRTRKTFHWLHDLHQAIVDLNTVLKPHLVILDGLEVMTTGGPQGPGELVRADSLVAGADPVAVDAAGVRLAPLHGRRLEPGRIRHIRLAAAAGLGRIDPPAERIRRIGFEG